MSATTKRILVLCLASVIVPAIFLIGGQVLGIDALLNWPSWILFLWPTSFIFVGFAGVTHPMTLLWVSLASIAANAVVWVAVGLPILWAAIDLPKSLGRSAIDKGSR